MEEFNGQMQVVMFSPRTQQVILHTLETFALEQPNPIQCSAVIETFFISATQYGSH